MSDNDDETEPSVSRDGVTVYQTYQEEQFGVPTVVLKLVSERDEPVSVQLAVELPKNLHIKEVGFHPDYFREKWSVERSRLEFEVEIGPDEELTTMYAVESLAAEQLDSLLDSLTIEQVTADVSGEASDLESTSQSGSAASEIPSDDVSADDLESMVQTDPKENEVDRTAPGSVEFDESTDESPDVGSDDSASEWAGADGDDSETESDIEDAWGADTDGKEGKEPETADEVDGMPGDEAEEVAAEHDNEAERKDDDEEALTDDSGTDTLIDEEEMDVLADDDEEEAVNADEEEAVDVDEDETTTVSEETAVAETDAETGKGADAESGEDDQTEATATARQLSDYSTAELIDELDRRVEAERFTDGDRERLQKLLTKGNTTGLTDDSRVTHLQTRVSDLEATMDTFAEFDAQHGRPAEAFAELKDELAALGERVDAIDEEVSSTAGTVEDMSPRLDTIEGDLESLEDGQETLESKASTTAEEVEDLSQRLDDTEADVESLEERQGTLESKVSTLQEWREQVKNTLGALGDL